MILKMENIDMVFIKDLCHLRKILDRVIQLVAMKIPVQGLSAVLADPMLLVIIP